MLTTTSKGAIIFTLLLHENKIDFSRFTAAPCVSKSHTFFSEQKSKINFKLHEILGDQFYSFAFKSSDEWRCRCTASNLKMTSE